MQEKLQEYFLRVKQSSICREWYAAYTDAQDAPPLYKKELSALLTKHFRVQDEREGVYLVRSGGSSGRPLIFPVDIAENHAQRKALAEAMVHAGIITPGEVVLNIFGYADMYRTASIMDDVLEKCHATTLPLSAHAEYADMYEAAVYFRPQCIMGTPSKLLLLAQWMEENNRTAVIPDLLYAGEPLRSYHLEAFARSFHTERIFSLYGSAETGIWGWSSYTEHPNGFRMLEDVHIEIIDADAEGYGTVAVTNFFRRRFPLFRYAIGDTGRLIRRDGYIYLELKGRSSGSFILLESHYAVDDIQQIMQDMLAWQLILDRHQNRERVQLCYVQNDHEIDISEKILQLRSYFNQPESLLPIALQPVSLSDLLIDPVTGKTGKVVDKRI